MPFDSSWAKQECLTDPDFNPVPDTVSVDYLQVQFKALAWKGSTGAFVIWVINDRAQQHHTQFCPNQLAIEAALLVTPAGTPVWLSGGTQAGKSTLTVALALGLGWKVISEDFVYVDRGNPVPVVVPLSLRAGAPDLIRCATGQFPEPLVEHRWFIRPSIFETRPLFKNDPLALCLTLNANSGSSMKISEIPWTRYIRSILPLSNAQRNPGGVEQLSNLFEKARCLLIENGTVADRLEFLSKL